MPDILSPERPPAGALPRVRPKNGPIPNDPDRVQFQSIGSQQVRELVLKLQTDFESKIRGSHIAGIMVRGLWWDWLDNFKTLKWLVGLYNSAIETAAQVDPATGKQIGFPGGSDPDQAENLLQAAIGDLITAHDLLADAAEAAKEATRTGPSLREALPEILDYLDRAREAPVAKDDIMDELKREVLRLRG